MRQMKSVDPTPKASHEANEINEIDETNETDEIDEINEIYTRPKSFI